MTNTEVKKETDVTCNQVLNCLKKVFCGCVDSEKKNHASSIEVDMPTEMVITSTVDNNELINKINQQLESISIHCNSLDHNFTNLSSRVMQNEITNASLDAKYIELHLIHKELKEKIEVIYKKINNLKIDQEFICIESNKIDAEIEERENTPSVSNEVSEIQENNLEIK